MTSSCKGEYSVHQDHPDRDMDEKPKQIGKKPMLKDLAKKKKV